jgi:Fur family peroxide stress response transcriptional regulator
VNVTGADRPFSHALTARIVVSRFLSAKYSQLRRAVDIPIAEVDRRANAFIEAARRTGFKVTHQRLEIFREIASRLDHPSAEAVFRTVRGRVPTVSLDTVYRTLSLLGELGLVSTLGPRHGTVRFDANLARHHHCWCVRCGTVRDIDLAAIRMPRIPDSVEQFGSIVDARIEIRGICKRCAKKRARKLAAGKAERDKRRVKT